MVRFASLSNLQLRKKYHENSEGVGNVKESVDRKQSLACQSVNISDPPSTLLVQQPSLVYSGDALNSQPGHLCKGVQSKLFSKEYN